MSEFEIDLFFNQTFDRVQTTLEFNPDWANGTGYLDHAAEGADAPVLAAGEMAKSTDNFGRRMIIVGTPRGNLVVFRRYTKEDGIYTYNASRDFDGYWMGTFCQGKQRLDELKAFFGDDKNDNVGDLMAYRDHADAMHSDEPPTGIARKHIVSQNRTKTVGSVTTQSSDIPRPPFPEVIDDEEKAAASEGPVLPHQNSGSLGAVIAAAEWNRARKSLQTFIDENVCAEKRNEMCALVAAYTEASENYFKSI